MGSVLMTCGQSELRNENVLHCSSYLPLCAPGPCHPSNRCREAEVPGGEDECPGASRNEYNW